MAADLANQMTVEHNILLGESRNSCYSCSNSGSPTVSCSFFSNPYFCDGYRLPTEAEWEYVARSGTTGEFWTADGGGILDSNSCLGLSGILDGGATPFLSDFAWHCGNNDVQGYPYGSKEVGLKAPNAFGIYDLHGNLAEWTADSNACVFPVSSITPYCSVTGTERITRGGFWTSTPIATQVSVRESSLPEERSPFVGLRLVREQ